MRILLKHAKIATFNEKNEILEDADLLIDGRKIKKIARNRRKLSAKI